MAFLSINGIEFPVAHGSYSETPREIGDTRTAFDGTLRKTRRAVKRDVQFESVPMSSADALAWDYLIRGIGEYWAFDSTLYGSKGSYYSSVSGVVAASTTYHKYGAGCLQLTSPASITYAPSGASSTWTVCVWRQPSVGTWVHYVIDSSGRKWVDGVRNDAASTTWFTGGSSFTIATIGADMSYDDLVYFPALMPTDWPAAIVAAGVAFGSTPTVKLTGDAVPETSIRYALGGCEAEFDRAYVSGSWNNALRKLKVKLQEI